MVSVICRIKDWLDKNIDDYTIYDNKLYLFHCGRSEVVKPDIRCSRVEGELGRGFYTAFTLKGCINGKYGNNGVISVYAFDICKFIDISENVSCNNLYDRLIYSFTHKEGGKHISWTKAFTLNTGVSKFTKSIGGQVVIHNQYAIDNCLSFMYSVNQYDMYDIYSGTRL